MPSARPWRAQARDHCACAREDPTRKAVRWQKFYVLQPYDSSASSTMSAACCWQSPSRRAKAPSARRTAPDQLAWSAWSLATTVWPLHPPVSRGRSRLTSTSNHSACRYVPSVKAASEIGIMVCRRVRRPSASPHRHRARTHLWCKGDCMLKRMRATGKPLVPNMGTFSLKPFIIYL